MFNLQWSGLVLLLASCTSTSVRASHTVASSFDAREGERTYLTDYESAEFAVSRSIEHRDFKAATVEALIGSDEYGVGSRLFLNPAGLVPMFCSGHVLNGDQLSMRLGMGVEHPVLGGFIDFVADYTIPVDDPEVEIEGVAIRLGIGWTL